MSSPKLAQVLHFDLYGKRDAKYDFLTQNTLQSIEWADLQPEAPNFFLVKKDFDESGMYETGFKVDELFSINTSGIKTHDDKNLVSFNKFPSDNYKYHYRVFDDRFINYDLKKVLRNRFSVMKNILNHGENISLIITRQESAFDFQHIFVSKLLVDINSISLQTKEISYCLPLYLYPESKGQLAIGQTNERTPNLNKEIVEKIAESLGLRFTNESVEKTSGRFETSPTLNTPKPSTFAPIDILDYIYAVLHSPSYREKYKEFLKIDFPRVPYPKSYEVFKNLIRLGSQLRQIHLLESPEIEKYITQYPEDGDNKVSKVSPQPLTEEFMRVYINDTQYFDKVPVVAWHFYIGGYQPAQKWLKDRKDRVLSFEDIFHYQKIIVALTQTNRLMHEIDLLGIDW